MNLDWSAHLVIVPVLLPLLCGALLAAIKQGRHRLKFALSYASAVGLLANALALGALADGEAETFGFDDHASTVQTLIHLPCACAISRNRSPRW